MRVNFCFVSISFLRDDRCMNTRESSIRIKIDVVSGVRLLRCKSELSVPAFVVDDYLSRFERPNWE